MELVLDRRLADLRIFPAIDIQKSGTRKEELILDKNVIPRIYLLRSVLDHNNSIETMKFLLEKMRMTKNNAEFFDIMNKSN